MARGSRPGNPDRVKTSVLVEMTARCRDCSFVKEGAGALGSAAIHHDATGHVITTHMVRDVIYGDTVNPDQLTIDP